MKLPAQSSRLLESAAQLGAMQDAQAIPLHAASDPLQRFAWNGQRTAAVRLDR